MKQTIRKTSVRILAVFLCMILLLPPIPAEAATYAYGYINANGVHFRKGPSSDAEIIRDLHQGDQVKIITANVNAEWHEVQFNKTKGYVNSRFVDLVAGNADLSNAKTGVVCNVKDSVNVREQPDSGKNTAVVGKLGSGDTVTVQKAYCKDGWHQVEYEGKTAYISARYLQLTVPAEKDELTSLTVDGGTVSPRFSPSEHGYVVVAERDQVTISCTANKGVKVDVNGKGKSSCTVKMPSVGSATVRISVGGKVSYTVYIVRGALIVGTWNIKRGNNKLTEQSYIVAAQQADVFCFQEVYKTNSRNRTVNNLFSLKTKALANSVFSKSISYGDTGEYGIGILSRYRLSEPSAWQLPSGSYEQRILQKTEFVTDQGKKVSVYNTHLSYNSAAIRKKQFSKILEYMNKDPNPYKILCGDFNAKEKEFAQMKGYTALNTSDTVFYNYAGNTIRKNEIDNILVTGNITALNVRMVDTTASDHKPLIAYLKLN